MTGPAATVPSAAVTAAAVDPREVARFAALAGEWWNPDGRFRPVHRFNDARMAAIEGWIAGALGRRLDGPSPFAGLGILDVGCGAGLVSEPLARRGAAVVGIDATARNVAIARAHAARSGLAIDYRHAVPGDLVAGVAPPVGGGGFDVVLDLEVVEHVPDPERHLADCASLVRPGGILVVATLNRTLKSFLFAIVGAEYVLRWLPRGTHRWRRFVRPGEVYRALARSGLDTVTVAGMRYDPLAGGWRRDADTRVNYMLLARRPTAPTITS